MVCSDINVKHVLKKLVEKTFEPREKRFSKAYRWALVKPITSTQNAKINLDLDYVEIDINWPLKQLIRKIINNNINMIIIDQKKPGIKLTIVREIASNYISSYPKFVALQTVVNFKKN